MTQTIANDSTTIPKGKFAEDETGKSYITFRGSVEIEDKRGSIATHARTVRFITTHYEDWRLDTVTVLIESPDRLRDTLDVGAPPHLPLAATLGTIREYIAEQERRIQAAK